MIDFQLSHNIISFTPQSICAFSNEIINNFAQEMVEQYDAGRLKNFAYSDYSTAQHNRLHALSSDVETFQQYLQMFTICEHLKNQSNQKGEKRDFIDRYGEKVYLRAGDVVTIKDECDNEYDVMLIIFEYVETPFDCSIFCFDRQLNILEFDAKDVLDCLIDVMQYQQ